ncbi:MOSC domain-containing protein [Arcobacter sp. KX21116]|uniref:MOSC domain-containing protein n=1 Tax=Arcobacter iocasae TaxID=2906515 RepID=UPI0035D461A6
METKIAKVLFIKTGRVTTRNLENNKRKKIVSAIRKYPVKKAFLTRTGFMDDEQGDLKHHGGENKALFLFSQKTYEQINKQLKTTFDIDGVAHFGENIILSNITESDICIGDIYQLGGSRIQITQPRQPCWKLSTNTNKKEMTKFIFQSGLTGWYAKVLDEGVVCVNDELILEKRKYPNLSIKKLNQLIVNPLLDEKITNEALSCKVLGKPFLNSLSKRYKFKDEDEQFSFYHT